MDPVTWPSNRSATATAAAAPGTPSAAPRADHRHRDRERSPARHRPRGRLEAPPSRRPLTRAAAAPPALSGESEHRTARPRRRAIRRRSIPVPCRRAYQIARSARSCAVSTSGSASGFPVWRKKNTPARETPRRARPRPILVMYLVLHRMGVYLKCHDTMSPPRKHGVREARGGDPDPVTVNGRSVAHTPLRPRCGAPTPYARRDNPIGLARLRVGPGLRPRRRRALRPLP